MMAASTSASRLAPITLKAKLTALTVGLLGISLWLLVLVSANILESQFTAVLSGQQFATTSYVAADLDYKLRVRIDGLVKTAAGMPADPAAMERHLAENPVLTDFFAAGMAVIGIDGRTVTDYPATPGRRGTYFGDRDYFRMVVKTGRPYIDKPIIGRALKRPVLVIAVPVFDRGGHVRAVLTGITDLTAPNFFGVILNHAVTGQGEFFVFAPKDNLIVAATDTRRMMTAPPPRGVNRTYDRFADGAEGSGVDIGSEGIRKLYSAKRIPVADWFVMAALPTAVAFAPMVTMRNYMLVAAGALTLLALFVVRGIAGRLLAPLDSAGQAMRRMTRGEQPLAALPVLRDDEIGGLIGNFNRLVEDRKRYELALTESEQRFRMVVEGAPEAIFVQTQGRFAYVNPATLNLFGATTPEQLLGQPVFVRIHPDDRTRVADRIRQTNDGGKATEALEERYLRFDGTWVDVEVTGVPFRYGDDNGALVFVRNIAERKRTAQELDAYRTHLEYMVDERTRRIEDLNRQLERRAVEAEAANRAKSTFLANMSHEIRTPMNAIMGFAALAQRGAQEPRLRDQLAKIQNASRHLLQIINDILDISKIEAGKLGIENTAFELDRVLADAEALLAPRAQAKGLVFVKDIDPRLAGQLLRGDPLRLGQILVNFGSNAVKFTDRGTVTLAAQVQQESATELRVRFEMRDTGIGIAAADQERLFEAFEQADGSTTRKYGGTGLGLAICRRLATLMGGAVGVDSIAGHGSAFWLTLPLGKLGGAGLPAAAAGGADSGEARLRREHRGARLLLVEDDALNREIALELLADTGLTVEVAHDGAQAVERVRHNAYDVILMDMQMPGMDGLAATRAIRRLPGGARVPIIAMTANAFADDRSRCLAAGMDDHIAKPMGAEQLHDAILKWLARDKAA